MFLVIYKKKERNSSLSQIFEKGISKQDVFNPYPGMKEYRLVSALNNVLGSGTNFFFNIGVKFRAKP